ncbi:MAG TPA: hypothetical protein DIT13_01280 [Verrucomicrobiales bacterium]|nr:hypothetical protein [Verrucomicrobiales bacterium]
MGKNYPSDVSDEEWELVKAELCAEGKPRGRERVASEASARACFNALRYLLKTGCQWRMLPKEYPPRSTVHDALGRWTRNGVTSSGSRAVCSKTWSISTAANSPVTRKRVSMWMSGRVTRVCASWEMRPKVFMGMRLVFG